MSIIRQLFMLVMAFSWQLATASVYDEGVLNDHPILYLSMGSTARVKFEPDLSGRGHRGIRFPQSSLPRTLLPNGEKATVFDGARAYLEVANHPELSVPSSGILSIEAWLRPDTLEFPHDEGDGYVHWAGKGEAGAQEYAMRIYSLSNSASPPRPNRISGYAFNLEGGLGSGSYFQDPLREGEWIHVTTVINTRSRSTDYPTGYVRIFKNGILRKTTALQQFDVVPGSGSAPLRIGTRDSHSFFKGAIGKFAVYNYELSSAQITEHVRSMSRMP